MRRRCSRMHFNPRSPDGERRSFPRRARRTGRDFNPRSPDGERRGARSHPCSSAWHFNPRSPDGERLRDTLQHRLLAPISIHAPRMGSDPLFRLPQPRCTHFNPRSPDGERHHPYPMAENDIYFNPRSPDGERHDFRHRHPQIEDISIHAPRMGSDVANAIFDSIRTISIHAPRMGSDCPAFVIMRRTLIFQSTLPGWGATTRNTTHFSYIKFQSTLPGWGATIGVRLQRPHKLNFNPRSPDGERPRKWTSSPTIWAKSSIFNTDCIADRR